MTPPYITFDLSMIARLKADALAAPTKRARINLHADPATANVCEMVIAEHRDTYVRPHRHPGKLESFHVIEGLLTLVFFDDTGTITDVLPMGGALSGRCCLYRQRESLWHTVLIETEYAVIHEVVDGPFDPTTTEWALWSPMADNPGAVERYLKVLKHDMIVSGILG